MPLAAQKLDYEFRISMPIPLSTNISAYADEYDLRELISKHWIEMPAQNRCERRGFTDPSCLSPKQINEYKSRIKVNHPVIVGGRYLIRPEKEDKVLRQIPPGRPWGEATDKEVTVADNIICDKNYTEFGTLSFYIGYTDKPEQIKGVLHQVTSSNSVCPFLEKKPMLGKKSGIPHGVAEYRTWSEDYLRGHGYLNFYISKKKGVEPSDIIKGTSYKFGKSSGADDWKVKTTWGQETENEHLVAEFLTWSKQYGESCGRLYFYL